MTDTRRPVHPVTIDQAESLAAGFVQAYGSGERPAAVLLDPDGGTAMFYLFSNQGTEPSGLGSPMVTVDLKTGQITAGDIPGRGAAGNLVMQMQLPWHSGRIAGPGGRILICLSGLAVCMLVVTGIMIWQRKRQTRQAR